MNSAWPSIADPDLARRLTAALRVAQEGAAIVRERFHDAHEVRDKGGNDPVTEVDLAVDALAQRELSALFPQDLVISEEGQGPPPDPSEAGARDRFTWLVDPIDGTREFVAKIPECSVILGLARGGLPVLGVVADPMAQEVFFAVKGQGAWRRDPDGSIHALSLSPWRPGEPLVEIHSRTRHGPLHGRVAECLGVTARRPLGSGGLKLGAIASGRGDYYLLPRFPLSDWDTCGPQAILEAAGGVVTDARGLPLRYFPDRHDDQVGFLAARPGVHERVLECLARLDDEAPLDGRARL